MNNSFAIKNEKGLYHCEDGPAMSVVGISKYWYLDGVMMDFDVWITHLRLIRGTKHAAIMRLKYEGK